MLFESVTVHLVDAFTELVRKLKFQIRPSGISIEFQDDTRSADERIQKLEEARKSLAEGLQAVDELKNEAQKNKVAAERALADLVELEGNKASVEDELKKVRALIKADVQKFREVAGIPSEEQRRKDKFFGFWSGVMASVVATGLVALISIGFGKARVTFGDLEERAALKRQAEQDAGQPAAARFQSRKVARALTLNRRCAPSSRWQVFNVHNKNKSR